MKNILTAKSWSPYAAGAVIGLLQIPAFMLVGTALGASSSFVTISSSIAQYVDHTLLDNAYIAKHVAANAKNWWQVALVVGVALGAFISSRFSGMRRTGVAPVWSAVADSPAKRFVMAFIGGFILLLGARIADGCTSGHGLSGSAQLALSGFLAVVTMFAGGIATAFVLFRKK